MSLRALLDVSEARVEPTTRADSAALAFVLNRSFLPGLRTLAYSMVLNRTLLDLPILVISEDSEIALDPLIATISDRVVIVEPDDLDQFSQISNERVVEHLRLDWIPKYTFLKWMLFGDHGFRKIIFLDADMVCLQNIDDLLEMNEADLYAGPIFNRALYRDPTGRDLALTESSRNIEAFVANPPAVSAGLNTGLMVINSGALSTRFRGALVDLAERKAYTVEQAVVNSLLRSGAEWSGGALSSLYNFNSGYLRYLDGITQVRMLARIKVLHFVGSRKPWHASGGRSLDSHLWHVLARQAAAASPLLAEPGASRTSHFPGL